MAFLMYTQFIFAAVNIGYAIGSVPIISYHYGAENYTELKSLLKKSLVLKGSIGSGMVLAVQLFARPLVRIFVGYDEAITGMTVHAFQISSIAFFLMGFNIFSSSFFTALSNGGVSAAISFLRTFIFKMSAVLRLPIILDVDGIWWAEVVAEVASGILSTAFLTAKRKKYHYL